MFKMECKNLFCESKDPQFYPHNKSTCKGCLCKKQRHFQELRRKSAKVEKSAKVVKTKVKVEKSAKVQGVSTSADFSTLTSIIATQQKMIDYQQRQADNLFTLTERLLSKMEPVAKTDLPTSERVAISEEEPVSVRIPAPTPRRYPRLSHTKDRLTHNA